MKIPTYRMRIGRRIRHLALLIGVGAAANALAPYVTVTVVKQEPAPSTSEVSAAEQETGRFRGVMIRVHPAGLAEGDSCELEQAEPVTKLPTSFDLST